MPAIFAVSRGQVSAQLAKMNVIASTLPRRSFSASALAVLIGQRELRRRPDLRQSFCGA